MKAVGNKYDPSVVEPKWQKVWEEEKFNQAEDFGKKPKFYALVEFPYPSGAGLHVGHARAWSAMDAYVRRKRMEGNNVLFPMGWDAFGLPAENYAIKVGIHPAKTTAENIAKFRQQCQALGLSFDWSREVNTTDPKYYKWTQWIFLQLLKKGLAYQDEVPVNWCPFCKTNLADEEVLPDGTHERCGTKTEKRLQKQWLLRITKYADRLIEDLKTVDYPDKVARQQVNWIGRSEGVNLKHKVKDLNIEFEVYDSIPQTFMAQTFVVIAPEHPLVEKLVEGTEFQKPVMEFVKKVRQKKAKEGFDVSKEKDGIFTGRYSENYMGMGRDLPIWVASFVLMDYGTGIVGSSAHDERDFAFAKKYGLPLRPVLFPDDPKLADKVRKLEVMYREPDGKLTEPEEFRGRRWDEVREVVIDYIVKKGWGTRTVNYHLHDWIFSRQHYWGEPIPIVHCPKCGVVPVAEEDLPVELPYLEKYQPTGTGESPLAQARDWLVVKCPKCGTEGRRETDTMPNWAGSNWYYIRYIDSKNDQALASQKLMDYWLPVDIYEGGFEHTTLHLLYSRFIYKFLFDIGVVPNAEPYKQRRVHGIVLGSGNRKMSKSLGNVINPDDIIAKFGADSLRLYEMFIGPFDQQVTWDDRSLAGCFRFLNRVWVLGTKELAQETAVDLRHKLILTVQKVSGDLEAMKFNTAVAAMMEFVNSWEKSQGLSREDLSVFVRTLAPMAPHLAEELWQELVLSARKDAGPNSKAFSSVHKQEWPIISEEKQREEEIVIVVSVDGKPRGTLSFGGHEMAVMKQTEIELKAKSLERVAKYLEGKQVVKMVYVPGKIVNFVTNSN